MEKVEELINEQLLRARIKEVGKAISEDYQGKDVVIICLLKGAVPFCTDLCESIKGVNLQIEYVRVSSYIKTESNGKPKIDESQKLDIEGKDVIITEDIVDTGNTLYAFKKYLKKKKPNSIEIASMLDKPSRREKKDIYPKYRAFEVPDIFVVGKGLDYEEEYRQLPYVAVIASKLKMPIETYIPDIQVQLGTSVYGIPPINKALIKNFRF